MIEIHLYKKEKSINWKWYTKVETVLRNCQKCFIRWFLSSRCCQGRIPSIWGRLCEFFFSSQPYSQPCLQQLHNPSHLFSLIHYGLKSSPSVYSTMNMQTFNISFKGCCFGSSCTCSFHFKWISLIFSFVGATCMSPHMCGFLLPSFPVAPQNPVNMRICPSSSDWFFSFLSYPSVHPTTYSKGSLIVVL